MEKMFVRNVRSICSGSKSSMFSTVCCSPALLTRMSIRPYFSTTSLITYSQNDPQMLKPHVSEFSTQRNPIPVPKRTPVTQNNSSVYTHYWNFLTSDVKHEFVECLWPLTLQWSVSNSPILLLHLIIHT